MRQSVWDDKGFQSRLNEKYAGYLEQYKASAPGSKIYFTPQPLFFNLTTEWAASLQKMYAKEVPVDEGLDQACRKRHEPASGRRHRQVIKRTRGARDARPRILRRISTS